MSRSERHGINTEIDEWIRTSEMIQEVDNVNKSVIYARNTTSKTNKKNKLRIHEFVSSPIRIYVD